MRNVVFWRKCIHPGIFQRSREEIWLAHAAMSTKPESARGLSDVAVTGSNDNQAWQSRRKP